MTSRTQTLLASIATVRTDIDATDDVDEILPKQDELRRLHEELYRHVNHTNSSEAELLAAIDELALASFRPCGLTYELRCQQALARSPFSLGDLVKVSPPFVGRLNGVDQYGQDDATGVTGRVVRYAVLGDELEIHAPGRFHGFVHSARCTRI